MEKMAKIKTNFTTNQTSMAPRRYGDLKMMMMIMMMRIIISISLLALTSML